MGIKGLSKVIEEYVPGAIRTRELDDYEGKVVAVDVSLLVYQYVTAIVARGEDMTNCRGESTSHLYGLFARTLILLQNGVKPVFVFDGEMPELKNQTVEQRHALKEKARKKFCDSDEQDHKYASRCVTITEEQMNECKKLLRYMGMPYIEAPGEADAQAAALTMSGYAYGVLSDDMDMLAFGAKRLLRLHGGEVREYSLRKTLRGLDMSQEKFIDLCLLMGSDYCPTIKGVGPKTAIKLLKTMDLDEIIEYTNGKKRYTVPPNFCYEEAKDYFLNAPVIPPDQINLEWKPFRRNKVLALLCTKHGFKKTSLQQKLNALIPVHPEAS